MAPIVRGAATSAALPAAGRRAGGVRAECRMHRALARFLRDLFPKARCLGGALPVRRGASEEQASQRHLCPTLLRPRLMCMELTAEKKTSPPASLQGAEDNLAELLREAVSSWQLDAFALAELTNNKPLSSLAVFLFEELGLVEDFGLDRRRLRCFFREIERGYDDAVPYHNSTHAASVMHAMHVFLKHGGLARSCARAMRGSSPASDGSGAFETMVCLLAAAVHDFEHKGLSNDFLIKTRDDRAIRYNQEHANENHHIDSAFAVLQRPECNFLAELPLDDQQRIRSVATDLVLSTDFADGRAILDAFTSMLDSHGVGEQQHLAWELGSEEEALLLLRMTIKCADLSHLMLGWDMHLKWVHRLEDEFFAQGDKERALGLPVSFLMDRAQPGVSETQVGFLELVVLPLFQQLAIAAPDVRPALEGVQANHERWRCAEKLDEL